MKNGFVHDYALLAPIERLALSFGLPCIREFAVPLHDTTGFIDLLIKHPCQVIAVEIEIRARRIPSDIVKAVAARVSILDVVMPTARTARLARSRFKAEIARQAINGLSICFLSLPSALEQLTDLFSQKTWPLVEGINNPTNQKS